MGALLHVLLTLNHDSGKQRLLSILTMTWHHVTWCPGLNAVINLNHISGAQLTDSLVKWNQDPNGLLCCTNYPVTINSVSSFSLNRHLIPKDYLRDSRICQLDHSPWSLIITREHWHKSSAKRYKYHLCVCFDLIQSTHCSHLCLDLTELTCSNLTFNNTIKNWLQWTLRRLNPTT